MSDRIETEVALYRAGMTAAEPIEPATLDELCEHLRLAIEQRVAAGEPIEVAIARARAELGEPRRLARECSRVRGSFGPALSPVRAGTAAVLVLVWYAVVLGWGVGHVIATPSLFLAPLVLLGLAARLPHVAALVAGVAAGTVADYIIGIAVDRAVALGPWQGAELAICLAGLVVLVPPQPSRWFLAMFAFGGSCALSRGVCVYVTDSTGSILAVVLPCALAVAGLAIALRLRGAWIPCAVMLAAFVYGTVTFVRLIWFYDAAATTFSPIEDPFYIAYNLIARLAAVGVALVATILASRGTRRAPRSVADLRARLA